MRNPLQGQEGSDLHLNWGLQVHIKHTSFVLLFSVETMYVQSVKISGHDTESERLMEAKANRISIIRWFKVHFHQLTICWTSVLISDLTGSDRCGDMQTDVNAWSHVWIHKCIHVHKSTQISIHLWPLFSLLVVGRVFLPLCKMSVTFFLSCHDVPVLWNLHSEISLSVRSLISPAECEQSSAR